ncbi:MAG: hypothetical protein AAAB13_20440 [Pseudomonas sp.]
MIDPVLHLMPESQLDAVLSQDECDIDIEFLGFTSVYLALASIIPKHWTVVDLGCAFAPQAFIFKDHAAYIGVDIGDRVRFTAPNTTHHKMKISDFVSKHVRNLDMDTTFAICSYVPPWHDDNRSLARQTFKNVFTYYPAKTPGNPFGAPAQSRAALDAIKEG